MAESVEDTIERNASKMTDKNYLSWLHSYELKAGGGGPRALVVLPSAEGNGEHALSESGASTVATREDADTQAVVFAKQWSEERLAGPSAGPCPPPPLSRRLPRPEAILKRPGQARTV